MKSLNEIVIEELLPNIAAKRESKNEERAPISLKAKKMMHRFNSAEPLKDMLEEPSEREKKGPNSIFTVPRGTIFIDRRMAPTPNKGGKSKVQQIIEI